MRKTILLYILFIACLPAAAQRSAVKHIIHGNRAYRDSLFDKSEVSFLKAIDTDNRNAVGHFNAGCAMLMQNKAKEAMEAYEAAAEREKDKNRLANIYHNMGWIMQASKQYTEAIECYKQSLRCNGGDDETRYNLVLCQRLLKNQPQNQDNKGGGGQDQQQQQQQNQEQEQQQQQEQQKQDQQQQEQRENEMSRENAEQMLQAVMQDEKQTQDKMQKQVAQPTKRRLQKQW